MAYPTKRSYTWDRFAASRDASATTSDHSEGTASAGSRPCLSLPIGKKIAKQNVSENPSEFQLQVTCLQCGIDDFECVEKHLFVATFEAALEVADRGGTSTGVLLQAGGGVTTFESDDDNRPLAKAAQVAMTSSRRCAPLV